MAVLDCTAYLVLKLLEIVGATKPHDLRENDRMVMNCSEYSMDILSECLQL